MDKEKKKYYIDKNNKVFDAETTVKQSGWIETDWAGIQHIINPPLSHDKKIEIERQWRDNQLAFADTELNKVLDGRGTGTESDWRNYRNLLRDYPISVDFPFGERPTLSGAQ